MVPINVSPVLPLISNVRLDPYRLIFAPTNDNELYGVYLWAQHAAASMYPLLQSFEVTLRNAIDIAARSRFGDKWWDSITYSRPRHKTRFYENIEKAIRSLNMDWEMKEKQRLGVSMLPHGSIPPTWSHDQIVAATELSTWQFALNKDLSGNTNSHLWPISMSKAFRNFNFLSSSPLDARNKLIDMIDEIRKYRNRVFHHEPIWVKSHIVMNPTLAVHSIRTKINLIEQVFGVISGAKRNLLNDMGVFLNTRRSCSMEELSLYLGKTSNSMSKRQKKVIRKQLSKISISNRTATITYNNQLFGIYKIR